MNIQLKEKEARDRSPSQTARARSGFATRNRKSRSKYRFLETNQESPLKRSGRSTTERSVASSGRGRNVRWEDAGSSHPQSPRVSNRINAAKLAPEEAWTCTTQSGSKRRPENFSPQCEASGQTTDKGPRAPEAMLTDC